ncbi:MAG: hypothetical protein JOZ69_00590 [Myxococcales bacterium]|nr:hypothetical protein [Myxococcales bacterium]
MPDSAGPLQRLVFSRTLWLILAWPLAGLAWQILFARRRIERAASDGVRRRELAFARNLGVASVALSSVSTLAHAAVLSRTPDGARALFEPIAMGGRVGSLDASFDLWFDPMSATFCALACLVALAAAAVAASLPDGPARASDPPPPGSRGSRAPPPLPARASPRPDGWRTWAWLQLSLSGALVSFLADGFAGTAVGWTLAGGAAAWLAAWRDPSAHLGAVRAVRAAAALGALLVGAALLFWGLGGAWDGDDYVPDLDPRFTPVRFGAPAGVDPNPEGAAGGYLTLTSATGALVFLDDARTPLARAPFVAAAVPAGPHTIRIRRSNDAADEVLGRVPFGGGAEVALVPIGPTLAFRAIADQLVVRGADGDFVARRDVQGRTAPGGTSVVAASMLAFLVAAWFLSGAPPPAAAPPTLGAVTCTSTTAMLGPYLLARLSFLFPLTPHTWAAVESVGAASLLAAAFSVPSGPRIERLVAFVGVAPAALTWLSLGAAGILAATYAAIVAGLATAAIYLGAALSPNRPLAERPQRATLEEILFGRIPDRLSDWFQGLDRWVVGAVAAAVGGLVRAGAWALTALDESLVAGPANAVAKRLVRAERGMEPLVGAPLGRLVWAILGAAGWVGLAYACWPRR